MSVNEIRRRSRWMLRVLEWNDPRARYPNIWHEGMPSQVLAYETVASRLRLGDLVAIYHPSSQRHAERGDRFLGICRVTSLRRAHDPTFAWIDMETAHRFAAPLDLGETPRRVFLCCDAGWPEGEVALFGKVFQAAVAAGWQPAAEESEQGGAVGRPASGRTIAAEKGGSAGEPGDGGEAEPGENPPAAGSAPADGGRDAASMGTVPSPDPVAAGRLFGGADYGADMRDPRSGTWLALLELVEDRLRVIRLEATGRSGMHASLRDADPAMFRAEAIGLDFPFGLPIPFAEKLLGGPFPEEGWWALAKKLDHMSRPEFLTALEEFRESEGELRRLTDETAGGLSPLHRSEPDLGALTYHGVRMIAEERSRYAVRPFESAQGRLLLEVLPSAGLRSLPLQHEPPEKAPPASVLEALAGLPHLPVDVASPFRSRCLSRRDALDAVMAARAAAVAVLSGETERSPDDLANGQGDRVRREGWIYGLERAV